MTLVMFGYFVSTEFFSDMTNINLKQILFLITYVNHFTDKEIFTFHQIYGKYFTSAKRFN